MGRKPEKRKAVIPLPEIVPKPALKAFTDIPEDFWARKPIEYLATLGIMDGYADGTFHPEKEMSRADLAVLLVKAKGFKVTEGVKIKFSDVFSQGFTAPYISMAVERKYISGYPDGTFRPEERITRAEAAQILARFSGLYVKAQVQKEAFSGLPVSHWASPAVAATKESGFFEYLSGRDFEPDKFLTRAEMAEIIAKTPFAKGQIEKLISGEK
ncbi:S-layer homology domain-containing protein [Candidatus Saganbacteria bacterium]|uniref:S-layer homology domain-containing protein n=1 Tax=Candidatus Saganbacteria bacterium TaxID=2575572 RepID=A0A9D6UJ91_UNCSA|nr:S-layer homology domain-containing protein [Candidatus Saganbacteria bacterium]